MLKQTLHLNVLWFTDRGKCEYLIFRTYFSKIQCNWNNNSQAQCGRRQRIFTNNNIWWNGPQNHFKAELLSEHNIDSWKYKKNLHYLNFWKCYVMLASQCSDKQYLQKQKSKVERWCYLNQKPLCFLTIFQ